MDLQNNYNKYFTYILASSSLFIAGNAAFFSITGLAHLFSGSFWSVIIMASSLELGKLVTASFLYRFWDKITSFMKVYLLLGVIILIGITSIGIFGYLSKAYQESAIELNMINTKLELYEEEVGRLQEDKEFMLAEMEVQIESLPENYITAKRNIREEYMPAIRDLSIKVSESKSVLGELKQEFITTGVDVGPILYVAQIVNSDIDSVVKWLILILIMVFDPLAVALVIATNIVLNDNKNILFETEEEVEDKEESSKDKEEELPSEEKSISSEEENASKDEEQKEDKVKVAKKTKFLAY